VRITFFAHGSRGDVRPMAALGWHLAARGHDVTIAVPDEYRDFVERAGLRTAHMPFNATAWLSGPDGQRTLHAGGVRLLLEGGRQYRKHAAAFDEAYEAAAAGADVLVANHLTWDRALAMGDLLRIPLATVYPTPYAPSRYYSSVILTKGRVRPPLLRRASQELADWIWWQAAAKTTNAFRRKLGLPAQRQSTFRRLQHAGALGLHPFSSTLFPRPADWPEHLKITGAWRMPDALRLGLGEAVDPEQQQWLDDGQSPVYLDFGSMPVLDPGRLIQIILSVLDRLGLRAIVSRNCVPPEMAVTLPDHVQVVGAVDHDSFFPRCAAVVHHGGAGSTTTSLRAGVPTMVCSVGIDQPWWGERVRRLGVGAHIPFRKLSLETLDAGLRTLLTPAVAARARALGATIRNEKDGLPSSRHLFEDWVADA
jgi:sterol 3beta-glucosyltransferase